MVVETDERNEFRNYSGRKVFSVHVVETLDVIERVVQSSLSFGYDMKDPRYLR